MTDNTPPTDNITEDEELLALRQERLETCPFKPCHGLDQDFLLRDIRTRRLLCSWCAIHTPTGYIGKDEAKRNDDRYFTATQQDYLVVFGICAAGSLIANAIAGLLGFWLFAFFVGGVAGSGIATFARRSTGGRVGRQSAWVAIGGLIVGMLLAPTLAILLRVGVFVFVPQFAITDLSYLICTATMGMTVYGIFMRRI